MLTSSGFARGIDYLDFLKFIVPTLIVDVLNVQQSEVALKNRKASAILNEGIEALCNISMICSLATQKVITQSEIEALER